MNIDSATPNTLKAMARDAAEVARRMADVGATLHEAATVVTRYGHVFASLRLGRPTARQQQLFRSRRGIRRRRCRQ